MEKKLKTDHYLNDLFEHINAPIIVWDLDHKVIIVNNAFAEISGHSEGEMIGHPLEALFPEENDSYFSKSLETVSREGGSVDIPILHKDGKVHVLLWNVSAIYGNDGNTHIATIGFGQDITKWKELEAQLLHAQKMEAIGVMAEGIAHDFNNILQSVSGYTQLLLMRKQKDDPDREYLDQIDRLVQLSVKLIDQLQIFGRKVESKLRPAELNREVTRIMKPLENFISKMISVEMHLSDDLKLVNVDIAQLEQILMNLVGNSCDVMPDGGKLVLETKNAVLDEDYCNSHIGAVPGNYVLLIVSDTGSGMDEEELEHIFEPFYTTKGVGKGTGLGLAMVYGIVKNHGGYITCYSKPGQGTVFYVYFPVLETIKKEKALRVKHPAAKVAKKQAAKHKKRSKVYGGNETILLVDDEKSVLDVAYEVLSQYGYNVITAKSGEEALEIYEIKKDWIDLIVLDIGMPGMGGHRCLEELFKINPGIKIIIASGYPAVGKVKKTIAAGAAGFIGKPYKLIDLVGKVRETLDFN